MFLTIGDGWTDCTDLGFNHWYELWVIDVRIARIARDWYGFRIQSLVRIVGDGCTDCTGLVRI
ncbi:MAG: hypothetical protein RL329_1885 [Bacteroidota bacterium]|jgi:hypothetical protein